MATVSKIRQSMIRDSLAVITERAGDIGACLALGASPAALDTAMQHLRAMALEVQAIGAVLQAEHAALPIGKDAG